MSDIHTIKIDENVIIKKFLTTQNNKRYSTICMQAKLTGQLNIVVHGVQAYRFGKGSDYE